ncbi:CinA family protein [Kocuria sp. p3-SID1433]|uniref:CinA family protein n=1 Tax=unclassified Kocuria TaxID=2649579 RepID=UPI0021A2E443|nr:MULTISPECIES: CinA family protein [unclassified Kocuria]MCT1601811.1 CinA family protein [Kocuria sp. p3-SID1428]MCT2181218.1 CinA family protein [Kocuria sp. p3-SID1433]
MSAPMDGSSVPTTAPVPTTVTGIAGAGGDAGAATEVIDSLAARAVHAAAGAGLSLGTAESLTGGALAAAIVSVPGASTAFEGSVVSYSHAVKQRVLGVEAELLERTGAVSAEVAEAMASGARTALGVDIAVSTTGVAGPEPHDGQPVGTVWLGVSGPRGASSRLLRLEGDREQIRRLSVRGALELLVEVLGASQ